MSDSPAQPERKGPPPALPGWLMLVHLLVLWAFAVVQPTLSVLADSVDFFFPLRHVEGLLLVVTIISLALLPPALMWLVALLADRGRPERRWRVHLAFVALLSAMYGAYLARRAGLGLPLTLVSIALVGWGFTTLYRRWQPARSILSVLAPAPVVFLVAFLAFTNASHLVTGGEPEVAAGQAADAVPVVVWVLDEFPVASILDPDEQLDRARFPNFARLAADSTWYRNTLSAAWTTFEAVPALLTGKWQTTGNLPIVSDHPENIFTLLRDDYDEHVIESFTRLCPLETCPNRASAASRVLSLVSALSLTYATVAGPKVVERRLPNPGNTWRAVITALNPKAEIDAESFETADLRLFPGPQFEAFLDTIRPRAGNDRPPFYFLHSSLPHSPHNHLPNGKLYRNHSKDQLGLTVANDAWANDVGATIAGWQRHLLQTQFVDRLLGELIDRLERDGLYDDALLVVVADHGANFLPGSNRRRPFAGNLSDIAMVPLFVKAPGQTRGRTVDAPLSTIDVLPTIADELGMDLPWEVDGQPARSAVRDRTRRLRQLDARGDFLPLDLAVLERQRRQLLELKHGYFGAGAQPPGLFGIGPARRLQGQPLRQAARGEEVEGDLDVRDSDELGKVDFDSPFLPALVRGRFETDEDVASVAVALNGVVRGSGYLYGATGEFEVMVDPAGFREGENDLEVLAVTTAASGRVLLHPIADD